MTTSLCRVFLSGVLLVVFVGFASAAGDLPGVRDDAAFFSPDTVRKAKEEVRALQKQYKVDLVVDTVPAVGPDKVTEVREMTPAERAEFFAGWARDRATAAGTRGVYVLICKAPGHLQVEVDKQTQKQAFTLENREKLRSLLTASFKDKDYDKGLLAGIGMVREALQKNVPPTQTGVVAREVKDYAGFFSSAAVERANADLKSLPRGPGKEVAIETFPTPPPDRIQEVERMSTAERNKFFVGWADERAREGKFDGVLVMICKRPGHSQVAVHGAAAGELFTTAEIGRLDKELLSRFRSKEYDRGLAGLVRMVSEKLGPSASVATTPSPPVKPAAPVSPVVPATPAPPVKPSEPVVITPALPAKPSEPVSPVVPATPAPPVKPPEAVVMAPAVPVKPLESTAAPAAMKDSAASTTTAKTEPDKAPVKTESTAHTANGTTATMDDSLAKIKEKATEFKEKATDAAKTEYPTWMWVAGIAGGLFVLWILSSILRALFGGPRQTGTSMPPAPQQPTPNVNPGYPAQAQAPGGYARPPQPANNPLPPQGGYPTPQRPQGGYPQGPQAGGYPQGAGYPQGGGYPPQGGYPAPPAPVQQGGGFVKSVIGGAVGGAAGAFAYDALRHGGTASPVGGGNAMPGSPNPSYHPSAGPPAGSPSGVASSDGYSAGGDFNDSTSAQANTGSGGDFDTDNSVAADGGGDFDDSNSAQANAGSGGDFDNSVAADAGGGDFDTSSAAQADAGGDFGDQYAQADAGSGGGFDAPSGDDQASSGGDFGGDPGGGDVAGNDSGGDFGDSTS